MDTSLITYSSNYQSGFIYAPVSRSKSNDTDPFIKEDQTIHPVVNTTPAQQVSQTSKTTNNLTEDDSADSKNRGEQGNSDKTTINGQALTQAEIQLLAELKQADTKVRQHEMAHIAAGGRYITSAANFTYKKGPDGKNYAVGGEVGIDTSPVPGDPQATIQKMRQVKNAALAPADPSSQDLRVASKATATASKSLSELMTLQVKKQADSNENKVFGSLKKNAADSYIKVNNLPETDTASFQISV